jgi:hypothetical protein
VRSEHRWVILWVMSERGTQERRGASNGVMRLWSGLALALLASAIGAACGSNSVRQGENPPPASTRTDTPYLWLSSTTILPAGGHLAVAVMNPTSSEITYGVPGSFDRWDGHGWVNAGGWGGSLDQWGGFGDVTHGSGGATLAIGFVAPPHQVGTVEYFTMPSLTPGWYRLGIVGKAFGIVQVAVGATAPVLDNSPTLTVTPELLPTSGGVVGLDGFPPPAGVVTFDQVNQFNQQLAPSVILQKLQGTHWVDIGTLQAHRPPPPYIEHPSGVGLIIPPLAPGAYRLVRHSPTVGELSRQFWVIQPPAGVALIPTPA